MGGVGGGAGGGDQEEEGSSGGRWACGEQWALRGWL